MLSVGVLPAGPGTVLPPGSTPGSSRTGPGNSWEQIQPFVTFQQCQFSEEVGMKICKHFYLVN